MMILVSIRLKLHEERSDCRAWLVTVAGHCCVGGWLIATSAALLLRTASQSAVLQCGVCISARALLCVVCCWLPCVCTV